MTPRKKRKNHMTSTNPAIRFDLKGLALPNGVAGI
jgi:hypothetical protein